MKIKKQLLVAAMGVALCGCGEQKPANPFFGEFNTPFGIAPFEQITIDHYREGMLKAMEEQMKEVVSIINNSEAPTFENTIKASPLCTSSGKIKASFSQINGVFLSYSRIS